MYFKWRQLWIRSRLTLNITLKSFTTVSSLPKRFSYLKNNGLNATIPFTGNEESMESNEDEDPMVMIGNEEYPLSEVNENKTLIARMTPAEVEAYVELYQKVNVNDDF